MGHRPCFAPSFGNGQTYRESGPLYENIVMVPAGVNLFVLSLMIMYGYLYFPLDKFISIPVDNLLLLLAVEANVDKCKFPSPQQKQQYFPTKFLNFLMDSLLNIR